jgi:4-diphosphocytidyl-2-C-methyl-D-erythritol kinase
MHTLSYPAPCKINLFLHITGRRPNGYHTLQSLFLLLDHGDTLHIRSRQDGQLIHMNPIAGVPAEQDLCIRAARHLQQVSGCKLGAEISIEKRTPMGGGLGGGSSDAATVLMALNQQWQLGYTRQQLMQMGVSLGADVPVFIFGQPAWAEGIGEELAAVSLPSALLAQYYVTHAACRRPDRTNFCTSSIDKRLETIENSGLFKRR